jgi:transglutaminase-like putative cysteine protease
MILMLSIHYSRVSDLVRPDHMLTSPSVPIHAYRDGFGNWCSRLLAPAGEIRIFSSAVVNDSGEPDLVAPGAEQHSVESLPEETLVFLLGSRYCETDRLLATAWSRFAQAATGWARVQMICDFVHQHITFGYEHASPTKSAWDVFNQRVGVCRDYAHLAIALCRCMNIPARYCTGYLGDIGVTPPHGPMDFSAWFEAFIGGRWHAFDPRNNVMRPTSRSTRPLVRTP